MSCLIKPFSATYYNPASAADLLPLVCPPYDVIDKEELVSLKKKSPYNFSRILLAHNNNYKKIGDRFKKWTQREVFVKDKQENLYLYEQKFNYQGKNYARFGIISLLRLDKKGVVFPHEYTLSKPKKDRKRIIEKVKANLSPIFVITTSALNTLAKIHKSCKKTQPFFQFKDSRGDDNLVWKIGNKEDIKKIVQELNKCQLIIADGHHRFEVAYDYAKKNKGKFKDLNYILAYITAAQKSLLILPTHRIIKAGVKGCLEKLEKYFYITKVSQKLLEEKLKKNKGKFCFGIYPIRKIPCDKPRGRYSSTRAEFNSHEFSNGIYQNKFFFLRLKSSVVLDTIIKDCTYLGRSFSLKKKDYEIYKHLDVYLLHKIVFPLLGLKGQITYTHNVKEAKSEENNNSIAFILKPPTLKTVFAIANKGYRLPQKSTYFYPKVPSGIVIRKFEKNA